MSPMLWSLYLLLFFVLFLLLFSMLSFLPFKPKELRLVLSGGSYNSWIW